MKRVEPQVYLVAKTALVENELNRYLKEIGDPDWAPDPEVSDGENLIEAAGRMCYRSWQPHDPEKPECSNPNVAKTREGNKKYIGHILEVGHGSILEHINMSFIVRNCSRVFTHELVRHRAGCAYSQESLRYVRLTDLSFWFPPELCDAPEAQEAQAIFNNVIEECEKAQGALADIYNIDKMKKFDLKKALTSMFRRVAPIGLATNMFFTANLRAMRHMISMRTSAAAEVEIRVVFDQIARICKEVYPNVFQDAERQEDGTWLLSSPKV